MSRANVSSTAVVSQQHQPPESFVPFHAALHSPVLSSATEQVSSFFANLSSELRQAGAFVGDGMTAHVSSDHAVQLLQMHVANGSFISVTDSPVVPWSTLAPAGFHGLHCEKGSLTNWFGVLIQFVLGIVAFSSLVVKRYLEPTFERRPWVIWVFDSSKQVVGTIFTHFFNLAISSIPSGSYADPCFWYMFNYALDCTVGLLTMWTGLSLLDVLMKWLGYTDYRLGDYGKIERFRLWAVQCFLYCMVQIVEKLVVFGVMMLCMSTINFEWLERMTINPLLETALALLIVPFFVNVLWFWIVDNLLMRSRRSQQRDSEDTAPYNTDAFVAPASHGEIDGDTIIVTTNSSDGTSGVGTLSPTSDSSSYLSDSRRRKSQDNVQKRSSLGGGAGDATNHSGGIPVHVHAGSVRYGKPEVKRNRWGEADSLLNEGPTYRNYFPSPSIESYAAEDDDDYRDDFQMRILPPPQNATNTNVAANFIRALQPIAFQNDAVGRHSMNNHSVTGAVTVHKTQSSAATTDGLTNNAFNVDDDDADDGIRIVSENNSPVLRNRNDVDEDDGVMVVPDDISNALVDIADDQQLVSADDRSSRSRHSNVNDHPILPAVRKHDNWRQQSPSTTSASSSVRSVGGGDRQQLLTDTDAVEIVPGTTSIDAEHVVTNIFSTDVNRV